MDAMAITCLATMITGPAKWRGPTCKTSSPREWTGLDLTAKDSGLKGFVGGFTDGRYGYFVPFQNSLSGFSG